MAHHTQCVEVQWYHHTQCVEVQWYHHTQCVEVQCHHHTQCAHKGETVKHPPWMEATEHLSYVHSWWYVDKISEAHVTVQ